MRASEIGLAIEGGARRRIDPSSRQAAIAVDRAERQRSVAANSANLPPRHA